MKMTDFVESLKRGNAHLIKFLDDRIGHLERQQEDSFQNMVESLEQKFKTLLSDEDRDTDEPEFLVPDLPKPKKKKRKSRSQKSSQRSEQVTSSSDVSLESVESADTLRKSSRLASKTSQMVKRETLVASQSLPKNKNTLNETYVLPSVSMEPFKMETSSTKRSTKRTKKMTIDEECPKSATKLYNGAPTLDCNRESLSPPLPPAKVRCVEDTKSRKSNVSRNLPHEVSFSIIKSEPLGSSTPTNTTAEISKSGQPTPKLHSTKIPKMKANVYSEQSIPAAKGIKGKDPDKILQEKSTNIKLIEGKCQEALKKKEDIMKSSAEETKRKREERARKVAASREAALKEKNKQAQKQALENDTKSKHIEKEKVRLECQKKNVLAAIKLAEADKRNKEEPKQLLKKPDQKSELGQEYVIDDVLESASSDEEDRPKKKVPSWATKENRKRPLLIQGYLDKKDLIRPWLFNESLKYPKLEILFAGENIKNRPRASSAFWNTVVDFEEAFPLHD